MKLLENNPRLAAAVELVLQTEPGVLDARVNPVTGRVLVRYDPLALACPVETLIRHALETSPLTREEFRLLVPKAQRVASVRQLLAMEAACGLFHVLLMGGFCPGGLVSAGVYYLIKRARHSRRRMSPLGYSESAVMN